MQMSVTAEPRSRHFKKKKFEREREREETETCVSFLILPQTE